MAIKQTLRAEKTHGGGGNIVTLGPKVEKRPVVSSKGPGDIANPLHFETIRHPTNTKITKRGNRRGIKVGSFMSDREAGAGVKDNGMAGRGQVDEAGLRIGEVGEGGVTSQHTDSSGGVEGRG